MELFIKAPSTVFTIPFYLERLSSISALEALCLSQEYTAVSPRAPDTCSAGGCWSQGEALTSQHMAEAPCAPVLSPCGQLAFFTTHQHALCWCHLARARGSYTGQSEAEVPDLRAHHAKH